MLKKFSVTNFKNFQDKITFDLGDTRNYKFNPKCVKDGIVNKAIIYGKNASGKTNLILAIFDIVSSLTDLNANHVKYNPYKNLFTNPDNVARFEYEFYLNYKSVQYIYEKLEPNSFASEMLLIDGEIIISRLQGESYFSLNIPELDGFDNTLSDVNLSVIKYVFRNTKIKELESDIAKTFVMFMWYVEKLLMFYSLSENGYIGFKAPIFENVFKKIIEDNRIKEFETFLKNFNLNYQLIEMKDGTGQASVGIKFADKQIEFQQVASSGMTSLALFYYWYINIADIKLLVIDEFDAFYHNNLSEKIVKLLVESDCQVILTTHNTSVMTNELMRPDCYFRINGNGITSLANATDIEIREAHNLEKIYRSGWFDE